MLIIPKLMYKLTVIPVKILILFLFILVLDKLIL